MNSNSLPLGQIISRITQERGSFAELTEESLLHEIEEDARKADAGSSSLLYNTTDEPQADAESESKEAPEDDSKRDDRIIDDEAFAQVRQELLGLIR